MCVCVGVCVCTAMRFVVLWSIELKLGMGQGKSSQGLRAYFRSNPIKGLRSSRGQVALEMPYGHQILGRTPDRSNAYLGSKVMQGSAGFNQGSNCSEMPCDIQNWQEEFMTEVQRIDESLRSCRDQPGSNRGHIVQECPKANNQIWQEEPLTEVQCIDGVKGHGGVSWD